jgi:hypothetical protein
VKQPSWRIARSPNPWSSPTMISMQPKSLGLRSSLTRLRHSRHPVQLLPFRDIRVDRSPCNGTQRLPKHSTSSKCRSDTWYVRGTQSLQTLDLCGLHPRDGTTHRPDSREQDFLLILDVLADHRSMKVVGQHSLSHPLFPILCRARVSRPQWTPCLGSEFCEG